MAESKTFLNVPYAQKEAAKALGAKWDATNKKWYVPATIDLALFAQWQTVDVGLPATDKTSVRAPASKASPARKNTGLATITLAEDKNFVAYDGDAPPWD